MKNKKKPSTAMLTFIAMIVGTILGLVFGETMSQFKFIGTIWLNCIKMIQIPLILCILVTAIGGQADLKKFGRTALRIVVYYASTTVIAILLALIVVNIIRPGTFANIDGFAMSETSLTTISVSTFFTSMFSSNMFATFVNADVLPTMMMAILFGIAILKMKNPEHKKTVLGWFDAMSSLITEYLRIIINLSPIGVLFLMADSFGSYGFAIFTSMAGLIATHWITVMLQIIIVYGGALALFAHMNLFSFLKKASPVWTFTLATCSSTANIPIGIKTSKEAFDVPDDICGFTIPLGASMNCDGLAICLSITLIFIAQMNGIVFDPGTLLRVIIVATLLSSAGSGIPGGGVVKIATIVSTFGLPVEIVGVMAGFYRLFDMASTTGNCLGDLVGTVCVNAMAQRDALKAKRQ